MRILFRKRQINALRTIVLIVVAVVSVASVMAEFLLPIWFYQGFALLFLLHALHSLVKKRILTAMALVPHSLVMLVGTALFTGTSLPNLARFPPSLMAEQFVSVNLGSLTIYGIFVLAITSRSKFSHWPNYQDFHMVYHHDNKLALLGLLFLGFLSILLTMPGTSILHAPYASPEQRTGAVIDVAGLKVMGIFFVCAAMNLGAAMYRVNSRQYLTLIGIIFLFVGWFVFLRGDRGGTLPMIFTATFLYLISSEKALRTKTVRLASFLLFVFVLLFMMSYFRANAARDGIVTAFFDSIWYFWSAITEPPDHTKSGLLTLPLLPQSFWHGLHVADLYEQGIRLNGRSFFDVFSQMIPSPIANILGYERALNGAWRLGIYRVHGGGMNSVALAYWNLGILGVMIFSTIVGISINWLENWYRKQPPVSVSGYFAFAGALPYLLLYGWQPLAKTLMITLVMAFMVKKVMRSYMYKGAARPQKVSSHT